MSSILCQGVRLGIEQAGSGQAMVLVHGAWSDRRTWDAVFPGLARHFHTIRYDRRGYGESQKPGVSRSGHAQDLLNLVRALDLSSVVLVGNSLGSLIAIRAGLADSTRIRLVIAHDAPLFQMLEIDPGHRALAQKVRGGLDEIADALYLGDREAGARLFVERLASVPGAWQGLPEVIRQELVANADAFLPEADTDQDADLTPTTLAGVESRLVITRGDRSSMALRHASDQLHHILPKARYHVFAGAGHVPHQTCPDAYVAKVLELVGQAVPDTDGQP
jgi:pimeloyl-ACP methyl ester carboxylesterase